MTVLVDDDPEKRILVPIFSVGVGATGADYSVPSVVAFNAGETSATITLLAIEDEIDDDDDDESVRLSFGPVLPEGVTQGTPSTTEVFITDNDLAGDRLMSLVVAPKDIDGFDPEVTDYMVGMTSTVTQATITVPPAPATTPAKPKPPGKNGGGQQRMVRRDLLQFRWSLECPSCGFKVTGEGQPQPGQRLARCGRCKVVLVLGGG